MHFFLGWNENNYPFFLKSCSGGKIFADLNFVTHELDFCYMYVFHWIKNKIMYPFFYVTKQLLCVSILLMIDTVQYQCTM